MSFDLRLHDSGALDRAALTAWLDEQATERGDNWFFEDEATGVAWWVDEGEEGAVLEVGFNLVRPLFFALHVVPWVADLAGRFGLLVEDPQADGEPRAPDVDALVESWRESNEFGASALVAEGAPVHWIERGAATAWWEYMRAKEARERSSEEFVPTVVLLGTPGSPRVQRLFTWTDAIPVVWPPADVVALGRSRRRLLRRAFEMRLVPADPLRERLGGAGLLEGDTLTVERATAAEELFDGAFEAAEPWEPERHEQLTVHDVTDADAAAPR